MTIQYNKKDNMQPISCNVINVNTRTKENNLHRCTNYNTKTQSKFLERNTDSNIARSRTGKEKK
jgi:hypothetical protein